MQKSKKIAVIAVCAALVLAIAGGVLVFAATPRHAVDFDHLTQQDIRNLYRQRNSSNRQTNIPRRLSTLMGLVENDTILHNGTQARAAEEASGRQFIVQQFLLTDHETHAQLHATDFDIQRSMLVHALTKLALVNNLQEVWFIVEFADLPEDNTIAQYLALQSGEYIGQGAYSIRFCADQASRVIGRDIRTVTDSLDSFTTFMHDIVAIDFAQLQSRQHPQIRPEARR
ncbi:MAG: hypothetical protein FWD06_02555 [Oscillospiraceae bacterium]|nr:hypothetical protein [Oscillospiraceae bacterium]